MEGASGFGRRRGGGLGRGGLGRRRVGRGHVGRGRVGRGRLGRQGGERRRVAVGGRRRRVVVDARGGAGLWASPGARGRRGAAWPLVGSADAAAADAAAADAASRAPGWKFGPPGNTRAGAADKRWYLITGWRGGLTPTHVDLGVQSVLYHTVAGVNRVLGVPRAIAAMLTAVREKLLNTGPMAHRELLRLERRVLARCLRAGKLQYAEFGAGETLLILPTGGHAVLTGRRKVVVAGEWHLCQLQGAPVGAGR